MTYSENIKELMIDILFNRFIPERQNIKKYIYQVNNFERCDTSWIESIQFNEPIQYSWIADDIKNWNQSTLDQKDIDKKINDILQ